MRESPGRGVFRGPAPPGIRQLAELAARHDPRCPNEYGLRLAFGVFLVLTAVLDALRSQLGVNAATAVMVGGVVVLAWWVRTWAALAAPGLAWLFLNGFLVNSKGDLRWHGNADTARLTLLTGAAVIVTVVRSTQILRRRFRRIPPTRPTPRLREPDADFPAANHSRDN
jgi:hypothetical protein